MKAHARILVTGAKGMVGSALVRSLHKKGFVNVYSVDSQECNLLNSRAVFNLFLGIRPQYVFHVAAKVGGIHANNTKSADFINHNIVMQANVFEAAKHWNVEKLIFCGSACIYPKNAPIPIKEESFLTGELEETNKAYAIAKIAGMVSCEMYRKQYGCNFISVMPTNLYGINDNFNELDSHVIPGLIRKIYEAKKNNQQEIIVWGTGEALREFLFADDLADALIYLMQEYNSPQFLNVGSGECVPIHYLVKTIAEKLQYEGAIKYNGQLEGVKKRLLDITKITKIGWNATVSLKQGLDIVCNWFVQNYDICRK